MAAIAVPNYLTYIPKARLNGAARMVMVDLMAARMNAVKTNRSTQVHFLDGGRQYRMNDDADNSGVVDNPEGDATLRDVQSEYKDVTIASWTGNPKFTARGTASVLSTITLENPSGSKVITVSITGRVKIG